MPEKETGGPVNEASDLDLISIIEIYANRLLERWPEALKLTDELLDGESREAKQLNNQMRKIWSPVREVLDDAEYLWLDLLKKRVMMRQEGNLPGFAGEDMEMQEKLFLDKQVGSE